MIEDQNQHDSIIRKGDVFQNEASDQTIVLGVNGTETLLFTGKEFIQATNIHLDDNGVQWDIIQIYKQFGGISKQQNEQCLENEWEMEM
jgi:hypothetical protein